MLLRFTVECTYLCKPLRLGIMRRQRFRISDYPFPNIARLLEMAADTHAVPNYGHLCAQLRTKSF